MPEPDVRDNDDENGRGPTCEYCGAECEWVDCSDCGGEGEYDAYEDDPLWYAPGDTEPCSTCDGEGGWWVCYDIKSARHQETVAAVEREREQKGDAHA